MDEIVFCVLVGMGCALLAHKFIEAFFPKKD